MSLKTFSFIDNTLIICLTIISITSAISLSSYHINDRVLMSKNIDNAIDKGIDPISVRCAYAKENDVVCISFAANSREIVVQSQPNSTKK